MKNKTLDFKLEIKQLDDTGTIEGYGSIFGNKDSYDDIVQKGAFTKSLMKKPAKKVKLLWQHDSYEPIGVWEEIREDENGLYCKGKILINTSKGADVYQMLKAGAIDGLSIGYRTITETEEEYAQILKEVDLWEISVVTFPANELANITSVKNISIDDKELEKDVEAREDADIEPEIENEAKQNQSELISKWSMKDFDKALKSKDFHCTNNELKTFYSRLAELKAKPKEEDDMKNENIDDAEKDIEIVDIPLEEKSNINETIAKTEIPEEKVEAKSIEIPEEFKKQCKELISGINSIINKQNNGD